MKKVFSVFCVCLFSAALFAQTASNLKKANNQSTNIKDQNSTESTILDITKSEYFFKNRDKGNKNTQSEILDPTLTFGNPQVAMAEANYRVTAGDVYLLSYAAGTTPVSYYITVDPTYKIRVSNLGVIDAAGKTYVTVKKQIEEIVTKNYPLSGMQFVLYTPAKFKVLIKGEVEQTTEATAWALTRLSTLVNQVTTEYSSIRNVKVTGYDGSVRTYDLFDAARNGNMKNDPFVAPGDVITLERAERVVNISGAVERPGIYQLLPGENLNKLISYYGGGFTVTGDPEHIEISRIKTDSSNAGKKFYVNCGDSDFELDNFDIINVTSFYSLQPVMFLEGAVGQLNAGTTLEASTKIPMQFYPDTNYVSFIRQNAQYFKNDVSDNANAYIIRGSEIYPININKALYDVSFKTDLVLQEDDILNVPFKQYFVTVAGAVHSPGRYPYIPDRTWDYYVGLAGGIIQIQNNFDALTITDMNGKKVSKNDVITPECSIVVKSNSFTYFVSQYSVLLTAISTVMTAILSFLTLKDRL